MITIDTYINGFTGTHRNAERGNDDAFNAICRSSTSTCFIVDCNRIVSIVSFITRLNSSFIWIITDLNQHCALFQPICSDGFYHIDENTHRFHSVTILETTLVRLHFSELPFFNIFLFPLEWESNTNFQHLMVFFFVHITTVAPYMHLNRCEVTKYAHQLFDSFYFKF